MSVLSDTIETFIKELLDTEHSEVVEVRRNELAQLFQCAPSQISYVLATRFTLDRGYQVESRRGGGGYIRITRIYPDENGVLQQFYIQRTSDHMTGAEIRSLLSDLAELGFITKREATTLRVAMINGMSALPANIADRIRGNQMRSVLAALMTLQKEE